MNINFKELGIIGFPSPYGVSFILIENGILNIEIDTIIESFRLLTEYHSFLYNKIVANTSIINIYSFRLLTEYHSFL